RGALGLDAHEQFVAAHLDTLSQLVARGQAITSLEGLDTLEALQVLDVGDNLIGDLEPLSGLTQLTRLDVSSNAVTSLTPLRTVRSLQIVFVEHNLVTDVSPLFFLPLLERVDLSGNPVPAADLRRLSERGAEVRYSGLLEIAVLCDEPPVVRSGRLTIERLFDLLKLPNANRCLEIEGSLTLSNLPLANLQDLSTLRRVDGPLRIQRNALLVEISALTSLSEVTGGVQISQNPLLESLDGLKALGTIGGRLQILNNAALADLGSFSNLGQSNGITISGNPNLQSIAGLEAVEQVLGSVVLNAAGVTSLEGLHNLRTIQAGVLSIANNPVLSDLRGLRSLETVSGGVTIRGNASLQTLDGLDPGRVGGRVAIENNPRLSSTAVNDFEERLRQRGFDGTFSNRNNGDF
ncbi:MAG: hypothetical protein HOB49_28530, partial [Gemmatimonadetes bacterium]|nr:hypothetical protein [Gemmatimonadota bacterium]